MMVRGSPVRFGGLLALVLGACGSDDAVRVPATAAPVPPTAAATPEDEAPCDPVVSALAASFDGTPSRMARPGGCGVQIEANLRSGADPEAAIRAAYPGWTDDLAQAAQGPGGSRFTLQEGGVQCTTTFGWGPMGPDQPVPWTARVDCSRRPG